MSHPPASQQQNLRHVQPQKLLIAPERVTRLEAIMSGNSGNSQDPGIIGNTSIGFGDENSIGFQSVPNGTVGSSPQKFAPEKENLFGAPAKSSDAGQVSHQQQPKPEQRLHSSNSQPSSGSTPPSEKKRKSTPTKNKAHKKQEAARRKRSKSGAAAPGVESNNQDNTIRNDRSREASPSPKSSQVLRTPPTGSSPASSSSYPSSSTSSEELFPQSPSLQREHSKGIASYFSKNHSGSSSSSSASSSSSSASSAPSSSSFSPSSSSATSSSASLSGTATASLAAVPSQTSAVPAASSTSSAELQAKAQALAHAEQELFALRAELAKQKEHVKELERANAAHHEARTRLQEAAEASQEELTSYQAQVSHTLVPILRELAVFQHKADEEKLIRERLSIGRVVPVREGHMVTEMWEDGALFKELREKEARLTREQEEVATERKKQTSERRKSKNEQTRDNKKDEADEEGSNSSSAFKRPSAVFPPSQAQQIVYEEEDEMYKLRQLLVKKELSDVKTRYRELEQQKESTIRFQKLMMDVHSSRFNNHSVLNQRYLMLNLLGKGGFSEVYRAFDLVSLRFVACKIHQLNQSWSDDRKRNYTRHATREYNIHKTLDHPRVVQLFDVFAIDLNCFCTVLEFCGGTDLDVYLKAKQTLPEREARCIIMQVFSGLKYLASQKMKIIHYDLKPGNILFDKGEVKITDFGLSKIMPESDANAAATQGIELTSQGAGTYWYLPPECFESASGGGRPVITNKVDIWSAGIILYQMLFGKKAFGHGLSPDKLLSQNTISKATKVEFPSTPKISASCRSFIEACLAHNVSERPDVFSVFNHPFLQSSTSTSKK
eukprot:CAMPEP_0175128712 /NCGR_PEP_ID=MMETSP0087-20121206/5078_1 /TAXON_ID=136419 /ORGANISM="Unknown Unknown, Strain D1" /LENGTH=836 /DNA_ID=CAMNT_0016410799 /DNA_START=730 /DNA_END=3240 /DNA_ORIENTATION=+